MGMADSVSAAFKRYIKYSGVSTSGKSRDFGSRTRRFESSHPSQYGKNELLSG